MNSLITNEKWIKQMSSEELAEFLSNLMIHCYYCPCSCENKVKNKNNCTKALKEWLKTKRICDE